MLHHVSVGVKNVEQAAAFYDAILAALGYKRTAQYLPFAIGYGEGTSVFWIQLPHDQQSASVGNGAHVGFSARSRDAVHRFHAAALAHGGTDDGAPGPRTDYGPDYYGAFVRDPDGNKVEATLHPKPRKARERTGAEPRVKAAAKRAAGRSKAKVKAKKAKRPGPIATARRKAKRR
jgi:catechol 2,3-dioxygenase-like lactoylglutathione lyase family enzyme